MASTAPQLPEDALERVAQGERVELPELHAALVPLEDLRLLEELEDARDEEEAARRLADPAEVPVPYDEARRRLGLA